jgi:hypothetical protein
MYSAGVDSGDKKLKSAQSSTAPVACADTARHQAGRRTPDPLRLRREVLVELQ